MKTNTMRYGWDRFKIAKSGILTAKLPWDCTAANEVNGFITEKTIPADSAIRVAFRVDENVVKITGETLTILPTQSYTVDSVLNEGNAVEDLEALSSVPAFVGKRVYPIIAMTSPPDAEIFPTLKLSLKTKSNQDQYTKTVESAEYTLAGEDVDIVDASAMVDTQSGGSVLVEASIYTGGAWSEWQPVQAAKGKKDRKSVV